MKPKKLKSISRLKREADAVFSKWIRARDGRCVTCSSTEYLQNGHYVPRNWIALRYDERNCNAQCMRCNVFMKGAMDLYALYLVSEYGPNILKELNALKRPHQFKRKDYEEIIQKYKI